MFVANGLMGAGLSLFPNIPVGFFSGDDSRFSVENI